MTKIIHRYRVTVDDIDYQTAAGTVVHVAADRSGKQDVVEVWVEHEATDDGAFMPGAGSITLNVYGTGHPIPDTESVHVGSVIAGPFVWHVYAEYGNGGAS